MLLLSHFLLLVFRLSLQVPLIILQLGIDIREFEYLVLLLLDLSFELVALLLLLHIIPGLHL